MNALAAATPDLHRLLAGLPGPASADYPHGQPFVQALSHGSLRVELFVPATSRLGRDIQSPHPQDELYVIQHGRARLRVGDHCGPVRAGDLRLVRAGVTHRFEEFSRDFATWVVFFGPPGGERP